MVINLTSELAKCAKCESDTYWRVAWDEADPLHPLCGTCIGL